MHASNLLKAVLKPQAPSSGEKSTSVTPCAVTPSTKISTKKAAKIGKVSTETPPVKMTCLCAPTKHAGSFRCRFHRSQTQLGANPVPSSSPPKTKDLEVVVSVTESRICSIMPEIILKPVVSLPAPPPNSMARSPRRGTSRLNRMVVASHCDETEVLNRIINEEQLKPVKKMATGTGFSFSSAERPRSLVFSMVQNGHERTKIC